MDVLVSDFRHALRLLRKSSVFSLVAIATLALGIGVNAAIYSLVDALLIRPLPYHDPDRVVMVWEDASYVSFPRNTPAPANYLSWKQLNRVFADMAATGGTSANLTTGGGPPEQVIGRRVTANFFSVLGVTPQWGRAFSNEEERAGAPVCVISYGLWQRRFAGRDHAIGTEIAMNGSRRTIVGVMPRTFAFRDRDVDFWVPMAFTPAEAGRRGSHYLNVVARLAPGVTLDRAREDMRDVAGRLMREYPDTNQQLGAVVIPIKEELLGDTGLALVVLLAASGCLLLIACANIASLLLSRALDRRGELAVRAALGATQARLVRQMVVESLLLALAGGAVGVAAAPLALRALATMVPLTVAAPQFSSLDPRLLTFAVALSVLTGFLCGVVPAVHGARGPLRQALEHGGRSRIAGRTRTRDLLVVAQVATALVLLVGAGLLLRTLSNLRGIDIGFRADHLLTLRTTLPTPKYADPMTRLAFYERVVADVRALPGVENAGYVTTLPFLSIGNTSSYRVEGQMPAAGQDALYRDGTAGYLNTIGPEVVEGRLPDDRDGPDAPRVAVVNQTFARLHWPGESALGRRVNFGSADAPWRTVVGVVKDIRERGYGQEMKAGAYVIYGQAPGSWLPEYLAVRTAADPTAVAAAVRTVIAQIDPEQAVSAVRTMDEILDLSVVDRSGRTELLSAFAGLALVMACLGLYGVLSYAVTQRRREIGVRIALGASAGSIAGSVIRHGLALTAAGLAIGIALAWAGTRAMRSLLVGVGATDPATFAAVVAVLSGVAFVASFLPAWRAARVDPMQVLRED